MSAWRRRSRIGWSIVSNAEEKSSKASMKMQPLPIERTRSLTSFKRAVSVLWHSLGSNITFKTKFDFTHTSFEVVQTSIILQHNILHFLCLCRPSQNRRSNLTYYVYWTAAWPSRLQLPPRIWLSCWGNECPLWQSITITNLTYFEYS